VAGRVHARHRARHLSDQSLELVMAIGDLAQEHIRDEVLDAPPDWVRWMGELGGIPEYPIGLAVAVAAA
jgi:hypothetical protein